MQLRMQPSIRFEFPCPGRSCRSSPACFVPGAPPCPAWPRRACRQVAGGPDNWDTSKQNSQAGSYNTVGPTGDPEAHQYAERNIERAKQVRDGQTERGMLLKETSLHKNTVGGVPCGNSENENTQLALEQCWRLGVGACCWSGAEESAHRELADAVSRAYQCLMSLQKVLS